MRQALEQRGQDDIHSLRKENAELRRKLQIAESAIAILRDLPAHRDRPAVKAPSEASAPTARRGEKRKRAGLPPGTAGSRDRAAGGAAPG